MGDWLKSKVLIKMVIVSWIEYYVIKGILEKK